MAAKTPGKAELLAAFFDDGVYTPLNPDGAISTAYGCANGQTVYVIWQNGGPLDVAALRQQTRVLGLAEVTGCPVVTFYDSTGARLEAGLALLNANARLMGKITRLSGVVPQLAVVVGVCGGSAAVQAAAADLCIVTEGAELFLNAPFTSDGPKDAGSAAFAARAGVAAVTVPDALAAAKTAAKLVGMLPSNNLEGPALFDFSAPQAAFAAAPYDAAKAVEALADAGSTVELYAGYGKNVYTALGSVNGNVVGFVATRPETLCHKCVAKAARFVRLCDAYSIPVVTVVNSEGFVRSGSDDEAGGIRQAARMAAVYAEATTVKVAVLAGDVVGAVYTVFAASADWRLAVPGCTVALLAPATAVSVLYKEEIEASDNIQNATKAKAAAYAAEVCGAQAAVAAGAADAVAEPAQLRAAVGQALDMLATKRVSRPAKKHGNMSL